MEEHTDTHTFSSHDVGWRGIAWRSPSGCHGQALDLPPIPTSRLISSIVKNKLENEDLILHFKIKIN